MHHLKSHHQVILLAALFLPCVPGPCREREFKASLQHYSPRADAPSEPVSSLRDSCLPSYPLDRTEIESCWAIFTGKIVERVLVQDPRMPGETPPPGMMHGHIFLTVEVFERWKGPAQRMIVLETSPDAVGFEYYLSGQTYLFFVPPLGYHALPYVPHCDRSRLSSEAQAERGIVISFLGEPTRD